MRDIPARLWKRIEAFIERAPIPSADRIRLRQFTVFVLLGVPTMVAYGLYDLARGEYVLSSIIFASAFGLSAGLYALGRMERNLIVYRINLVLYCALLVYMLVVGGEGGSKILWMYTFPFIAFFLIGKREGILWAGGMLLLGAALLMGAVPGLTVYPYPKDFRIRFLTIYAIVAAIAFWFEHFRETYRTGMETKCLELEDEKAKSQESEEGLKKAQQFANVGSWTWHIQSNRLEWSEQMFRIFGIDKDGFTGDLDEVIACAIHPDDRAAVERSNMFVVRDKKPMPLEYRILQPDGTVRTVWAEAGELILDDAGKPAVLRGIVQDITERKRAEQTQALMAAMLDATPGFVGFADAKDTHILYINPAGRKMVGIQAQEDVTQFKIADVHPEWTNKLLHDEIIPTAIRDGMWIGESAFLNRDGREIPVLMVLLSHKSPKGEVERFSTVSIDITDRKRAEEEKEKLQSQLQQAMKMEAMGRLAGGVAHDFNNLLTVITGYSELLLQQIGKESPMHREVEEIKRAAERAAALTQQLLAFSRKQIIDPKVVRPGPPGGGDAGDADPPDRREHRVAGRHRQGLGIGDDRPGAVPADPDEPGGERPGRDAGGWRDRDRDGERGSGRRLLCAAPLRQTRAVRDAGGQRHRGWDERRSQGAHLRAVLHHEEKGKRNGPGPCDNLRHGETVGRLHRSVLGGRYRDDRENLPAACRGGGRETGGRRPADGPSGRDGDGAGGGGRGDRANLVRPDP